MKVWEGVWSHGEVRRWDNIECNHSNRENNGVRKESGKEEYSVDQVSLLSK